jgi:hypothetical protein
MPPGTRKSKVFADVARPLMDYQYDELERMKSIIAEAITSRRVAEKAAERAETEASKASPTEATRKRAEAISAGNARDAIQIPEPPRLLASDATPEALKSLLARSPYERISLLSPEGDVFNMMAGRYQSTGGPPLEVYLNGHAGDYIQVDRKGRPPEHVRRPALTIGLAVQPDVLQSIAVHPGFRGQGLLGRFLYSLPADNVGYRVINAPPVPANVGDTYRTNLQALVRSLTQEAETAKLNVTSGL